MAEPELRDPVPPEPARRRGPQPVRAATNTVSGSAEDGSKMRVEQVPMDQVPTENATANTSGRAPAAGPAAPRTSAPGAEAVIIDPSHELPPPPASVTESPRFTPAAETNGSRALRNIRTRPATKRPPKAPTPSQEMLNELRSRIDELRERVEKQTAATGMSLMRELTQDADYVKIRARYYHQRRPLQAVGMVAAAGFALGLFLGLWRQ